MQEMICRRFTQMDADQIQKETLVQEGLQIRVIGVNPRLDLFR